MEGALMSISDRILLRKRAIIETVNDELKNIAQVEHSFTMSLFYSSFPSQLRQFSGYILSQVF